MTEANTSSPAAIKTSIEERPLTIGISTSALFHLEEEDAVFKNEGVEAYARLQRERENVLIERGTGFAVVERLLSLNPASGARLVDVILLSKNSPDLSLRAFKSAREYGLTIERGSFTSGRSVVPLLKAWGVDLFLSKDESDVGLASSAGIAAARLMSPPDIESESKADEVRIAFDGDAVLFSPESDNLFKSRGLTAFLEHEQANALVPLDGGPHGPFLHRLAALWKHVERGDGTSRVRIALVTARNAPAHERVINTLRQWGTPVDEAHFVGRADKAQVLKAFGAHIFFDDQVKHVMGAASIVPSGLVPGPHDPESVVLPTNA